jgi:phosphinothricin acetyltransferase
MASAIRLAFPPDAPAIAEIYRPYVEHDHVTFEEVPPDAVEIGARMATPIHPWLVCEEDGRVVGYASTAPMRSRAAYRWSVETGIYLAAHAKGRGLGRMLLGAHLALLERQGFVTAIAAIALPNDASVRLHETLGFGLIGIERGVGFKLGRWIDVGRWQRELAPRSATPRAPVAADQPPRCGSASQ